jgi:uncharacterized protein YjbI with pentapeptide repeats
MSNYNYTNSKFSGKDALANGDNDKVIRGSDFETEFSNIETAIATKADINNQTHTGTTVIATADINAGTIDNVAVGSATITGSTVDNTVIGGTTAAAITGTTIDGTTITGTTVTGTDLVSTDVTIDTDVFVVDGTTNDNVGIGTATPDSSYKLDVSGDVRATNLHGAGANITGVQKALSFTETTLSGTDTDINITLATDTKQIVIILKGASASGTNRMFIRLGTGGVQDDTAASYTGGMTLHGSTDVLNDSRWYIAGGLSAGDSVDAVYNLYNVTGNTWVINGQFVGVESSSVDTSGACTGTKTLSGTLDFIRLGLAGSDTWDDGEVYVSQS